MLLTAGSAAGLKELIKVNAYQLAPA